MIPYSQHCTRGEIIACLYNQAAGTEELSPTTAEELVHKQLGDARTLEGRTIPSQEGFIGAINGIPLNVMCTTDGIDITHYPHGDGLALINALIDKRLSAKVGMEVLSDGRVSRNFVKLPGNELTHER